jgi:hypothetical protein
MDYKITDYNYITSAIGNAYFSGVSFDQLWNCVVISSSREELDTAVLATIRINDLTKEKNND